MLYKIFDEHDILIPRTASYGKRFIIMRHVKIKNLMMREIRELLCIFSRKTMKRNICEPTIIVESINKADAISLPNEMPG